MELIYIIISWISLAAMLHTFSGDRISFRKALLITAIGPLYFLMPRSLKQ